MSPLTLSVPSPCAEDFAAMPRQEAGRFCSSCAKVVTDFTNMTDREVTDYVRSHGFGCGIFRNDQLERALLAPVKKNRWQRWAAALALLAGTAKESGAQQLAVPTLTTAPGGPQQRDTSQHRLTAEELELLPTFNTSDLSPVIVTAGSYRAPMRSGLISERSSTPQVNDSPRPRRRSFLSRLQFWRHP